MTDTASRWPAPTRLERGAESSPIARPPGGLPRWLRGVLGVPLLWKVGGANLLIVVAALVLALRVGNLHAPGREVALVMLVAVVLALAVNLVLVYVALRPLKRLEETAGRVWRGDLGARVVSSPIADRDMQRVGGTINVLLDGLTSDRERLRRLAAKVISAQDAERARLARELHDSTAQSLAGLLMQISALARDCGDNGMGLRLHELREMAASVLEEVRTLSHTLHPRVLDDLGLAAALDWLARRTRESSEVEVTVDAPDEAVPISPAAESALYRVAQESLNNAVRHANPSIVSLTLAVRGDRAVLEVVDDGIGFDMREAEMRRPGMGLFSMRERVGLVDGRLSVDTAPGDGTRVTASVPLAVERTL